MRAVSSEQRGFFPRLGAQANLYSENASLNDPLNIKEDGAPFAESTSRTTDNGGPLVEQMIENSKRHAQKAINQASDYVDSKGLMDQAQQWLGSAKPYLSDVAKKSSRLTQRYPLQAVLGAAVIGFICAALFRRRVI